MRSTPEPDLIECRAVFEWDESKIEIFCHKHGTKIAEYSGDPKNFDLNTWTSSEPVRTAWNERACKINA